MLCIYNIQRGQNFITKEFQMQKSQSSDQYMKFMELISYFLMFVIFIVSFAISPCPMRAFILCEV